MAEFTSRDTHPASPTDTAESLYIKARERLKASDYRQAATLFDECLRMEPGHVLALIGLAQVQQITGHVEVALTAYRQALKRSPDNPSILIGIANCYRAEGDAEKAVAYYNRALKALSE